MSSGRGRLDTAFVLTLIGSVLVLISGIVMLVIYVVLAGGALGVVHLPVVALRAVRSLGVLIALVTLVPGALGLLASMLIRSGHYVAGGLLAIVAAIASLPLFLGVMLAGFLTLLIGGILAIVG